MRRGLVRVVIAIAAALMPEVTSAQSTTTYHLHQEASVISSLNRQLKTANPDSASTTILSINLKNLSANQVVVIEDFETQTGVPNLSGTIAAGSVVSFSLWMRKTAAFGTFHPAAALFRNSTSSELCGIWTGSQPALTTTLTKYTFTCTTPTAMSWNASDRFFLSVSIFISAGAGNKNVNAQVQVEGVAGGDHDSTVIAPNPVV